MSFLAVFNDSHSTDVPVGQHSQFIPKSPHSHGETDMFAAPDQEQTWTDNKEHLSHGNKARTVL